MHAKKICVDTSRTHVASASIGDMTARAFNSMLPLCLRTQVGSLEKQDVTGADLRQAIMSVRLETGSHRPVDVFPLHLCIGSCSSSEHSGLMGLD